MGAVENDMQPVQAVRQGTKEVQNVAVLGIREPADAADLHTGRGERRFAERRLDAVLDDVGQLRAALREELDPVVGSRVVRRGDHDAEIRADVADEERGGGSGQHTGIQHIHAGRREPRGHRRDDEFTRDPWIPRDHRDGAAP